MSIVMGTTLDNPAIDRNPPVDHNISVAVGINGRAFPDRFAFAGNGGDPITFGEFWGNVERTVAGLRQLGLSSGQRVVVMVPPSPQVFVVILAVWQVGGTVVFVDPHLGLKNMARAAASVRPSCFIGTPRSQLLRLLDPALRSVPIAISTESHLRGLIAHDSLARWLGDEEPICRQAPHRVSSPDDAALISFTTGSSGPSKGVIRTHGCLRAQYDRLVSEFTVRSDDVDMPALPLFTLVNLIAGTPTVLPDQSTRRVARMNGARIVRQMRSHGVTTASGSPPFFDRLTDHVLRNPDQAPRLRRIATGGAPVRDDQLKRWQAALPETEIEIVYGATEAEPIAHISASERLRRSRIGAGFCVGRPIDALRTRLQPIVLDGTPDATDRRLDIRVGEVGELLVAGAHVCRDYFENEAAHAENKVVDDDATVWHRTGDTGYFDDAGDFWLVGRRHTTIVRDGRLLHPQQIEQIARGHDNRIDQVAALGLQGADRHMRCVVVVSTRHDVAASVWSRLQASNLSVDCVMQTGRRLPVDRRHNQKIDYARLRRDVERGHLRCALPDDCLVHGVRSPEVEII